MKRAKLLKELRRYANMHDVAFEAETRRGKGSHIRISVGDSKTIVKNGELSDQYVDLILKQLSIPKDAIRR